MKCNPTASFGAILASLCLGLPATAAQGAGIDSVWRDARNHAMAHVINPDDHACGPTVFDYWFTGKVYEMGVLDFYALAFSGALDWSSYHGLEFNNDASDDFFGVSGERSAVLVKRHKDNQRFWDVPTDDILLLGMHGTVIESDETIIPTIITFYRYAAGVELSETEAKDLADLAQAIIEGGTEVDLGPLLGPILGLPSPFPYTPQGIPGRYNHPFLSLNAFAAWSDDEPEGSPFAGLPRKIIMGDGIMEAYDDIGELLGDPNLVIKIPDFIHAHEFAHHVTGRLGVFDGQGDLPEEDLPEATRRTELMADAFGAYYCAHAKGAAFQVKSLEDVVFAAYSIGDCYFDDPGHHGTPRQRYAAAQWGAELASSAKERGQVKAAWNVLDLFEAKLPELVAPDAP